MNIFHIWSTTFSSTAPAADKIACVSVCVSLSVVFSSPSLTVLLGNHERIDNISFKVATLLIETAAPWPMHRTRRRREVTQPEHRDHGVLEWCGEGNVLLDGAEESLVAFAGVGVGEESHFDLES